MKYARFEDLPVWKAALEFSLEVFELVKDRGFGSTGDLRDQLQRASLSISLNIAEGFERGSTAELLQYLYIARGSAGESRSALRFCERYPAMGGLKRQILRLIALAESISRQIRAWADSLQNSDIAGQRHLNDQSRADYHQRRRSAAFLAKLDELRRRAQQAPAMDDRAAVDVRNDGSEGRAAGAERQNPRPEIRRAGPATPCPGPETKSPERMPNCGLETGSTGPSIVNPALESKSTGPLIPVPEIQAEESE